MGQTRFPLISLLILASGTASLACFCDHYPWSSWTYCTRTCGQGTQERSRHVQYDEHWINNNCVRLCKTSESRMCNVEACPIHCQLTKFGPWSDCSPCVKKMFRTRSVLRPSQFGGQDCTESLMEERPCHPSKDCKIEPVDCKDKFTCDNGRCIKAVLECNGQNDCMDNSDEKDCRTVKQTCVQTSLVPPGMDLIGNGFDAVAEQMRGAVLDNSFMGDECVKVKLNRRIYRIPANIEYYNIKVENLENITGNPQVKSEAISLDNQNLNSGIVDLGLPLLLKWLLGFHMLGSGSFQETIKSFQQKDSKYFRVHQVVATSTFRTKPSDLYLSDPFLKFLNSLPLEYNYPLYRQIFQLFGTHYFSSGTLGGKYDLLFQYDREELTTEGLTEETSQNCIREAFVDFYLVYYSRSNTKKCGINKMSSKYKGSFLQTSEKVLSKVKGGRAEFTAALAWERNGAPPDSTIYQDWLKSTIENPTVIEHELIPLENLVRGFPCAVTKRRHMQRALTEYLATYDSCKCAPCPNNARAALSGTECLCICQTGTYGPNCEKRAKDYTSEVVDGYWNCWSPWTTCDSSLRRHRTRVCNNPAPQRGGKPCQGPGRQEEDCSFSVFQEQNVCISDGDFVTEGESESVLPPGEVGCPKPRPPLNSYLRINKRHYGYGDHEEFVCFTGFELEGYQLIRCLPDGTWEEAKGRCLKKMCARPEVPNDININPSKAEYRVESGIMLSCTDDDMSLSGPRFYTCTNTLTWEPPVPSNIHCKDDRPFVPDSRCGKGEHYNGSKCVCMPRENCRRYKEDFCVLDAVKGNAIMMSFCAFHAGRCHGDKLYFMNNGPCKSDVASLDWARFRASVSEKSSVQDPCGSDTCYEWETCSASSQCICKLPRNCSGSKEHAYCLNIMRFQRKQTMHLCSMAAMKCSGVDFEILNEGECKI